MYYRNAVIGAKQGRAINGGPAFPKWQGEQLIKDNQSNTVTIAGRQVEFSANRKQIGGVMLRVPKDAGMKKRFLLAFSISADWYSAMVAAVVRG